MRAFFQAHRKRLGFTRDRPLRQWEAGFVASTLASESVIRSAQRVGAVLSSHFLRIRSGFDALRGNPCAFLFMNCLRHFSRRHPLRLLFRRPLLGLLTFAMGTGAVFAQADPLKKEDIEKYLEGLENLRKAIVAQRSQKNGVALKAYVRNAASPTQANAFYLDCLKKLRFTDENKRSEAWRTYREDNEGEIDTTFHREARQMELRYLILTIEAAHVDDRRDMMPKLLDYIDKLVAMDGRAYEFVESADASVFTEAYGIENTIDPGFWEMSPTNVGGIYDQAILPHLREHRDERLISAWQSKIKHMTALEESRKAGKDKAEREEIRDERRGGPRGRNSDPRFRAEARDEIDRYETFMSETLPELKWEMCKDLLEHGFRDQAIPLMVTVIRDHAEHQEVITWLNELEADLVTALAEFGIGTSPGSTSPTAPDS